jgi:hypothetical protein
MRFVNQIFPEEKFQELAEEQIRSFSKLSAKVIIIFFFCIFV